LQDSSLTKDAYQSYIFSEGKVKVPNHTLINALYERAIADFASRRWQALVDNADAEKVKELEQTLRYFWCEYVDSLVCFQIFFFLVLHSRIMFLSDRDNEVTGNWNWPSFDVLRGVFQDVERFGRNISGRL